MLLSVMPVMPAAATEIASGTCGDNLTWVLNQYNELIISGMGDMEDYLNPDPGLRAAPWLEFRKSIRKVIIEDGVTSIGSYAFSKCNFSEIYLPSSLSSIGEGAFFVQRGSLRLTCPEGLASIGDNAFRGSDIRSITFSDSLVSIGDGAFYLCDLLGGTITFPEGLVSIGDGAFNFSSIRTAIFLGTPDNIGENVFDSLSDVCYAGTREQWQWSDIFCYGYVHYSCTNLEGHWIPAMVEATCGVDGYIGDECRCGHVRKSVNIPATGDHADADRDHACDVCSTIMGEHEAAEGSHNCAYCGERASNCADADRNHACDLCGAAMGEHAAAEGSHNCAYCGETLSSCADADRNHACDVCGAAIGEHAAAEGSHDCAYCGERVTGCADADRNHACDLCGAAMGEHAAAEGSHNCAYCGETLSSCADADRNHACDVCGAAIGEHAAAEGSHDCAYCGERVTDCADVNRNHACDVCGAVMGEHAAAEGSHNCAYCGGRVTDCTDEDIDAFCDVCGEVLAILRLSGSNRYATGVAIAEQLKANMGVEQFETVIVAYGQNFPDALTGSYLAAVKSAPILLTEPSQDAALLRYLRDNLVEGGKVYILGGTSAVSEGFEMGARNLGFDVQRLKGAGRYETNLAILAEAGVNTTDEVLIATGKGFADSLSASATGLPMLLVDKNLTDAQKAFLVTTSCRFVILGGTGAVSAEVEAELSEIGTVTRVKGSGRYETSVAIACRYFENPRAAVLAYAQGFPDGLCGGPLALSMGAPLILTSNEACQVADDYIDGITTGAVTGGTGRISDDTVREIFDLPADAPIVKP